METFLQFFWLICGAWVGFGNAAFFRVRLREAVSAGTISRTEADRFAWSALGWIGGPCLVFWVLHFFLSGAVSPDFRAWAAPYGELAKTLAVLWWVVAFSWIWFFGGDRKLARIYTLARYQTFVWKHPWSFRIAILLAVVGSAIGMLIGDGMEWPPE